MIKIKGKRNTATVFADKIDRASKTQISSLLREEAYSDCRIRIMPDVHSGRGVAVGTTMTLSGRVNPALIGVDIGCGMEVIFLENRFVNLSELDNAIHSLIPCGAKIHAVPKASFDFNRLLCKESVDTERALLSLGTLGGGNHFIELDITSNGDLVLVIHSGSRQLGSDVAAYYQDQAYRYQCKRLRKSTRQSYYEARNDEFHRDARKKDLSRSVDIKREDAILEGALFKSYLNDLKEVTDFADKNRKTIAETICCAMDLKVKERFSSVHNYIDAEHMILRKGAISARRDERVIIPLNMRDGAILGVGLGNPDWNFSAPHGAGRICSRTEAKFNFTLEEYRHEMTGIYTTTAEIGSIDECPMAYKPPERIIDAIGETVDIEQIIKPIYNFKAC